SSRAWLALRPQGLPQIRAWEIENGHVAKPPKGTTHIVLDTPAGFGGKRFEKVMQIADRIIVPLQPSMFDILATQDFLERLAERKKKKQVEVGVIGMRVQTRTRAADQLQNYVENLGLPVLGFIRDTQNYVQLAAHGRT